MLKMKKGQKINKFPGSGYITNKVCSAVVVQLLYNQGLSDTPSLRREWGENGMFITQVPKVYDNVFFSLA